MSNNNEQHFSSRMVLNDHKAGMQGLDKEKINKYVCLQYFRMQKSAETAVENLI